MSAVLNILISLKHGNITQAQAAAEIEELIELERLQLRDTFAGQAMQGMCAHPDTWGLGFGGIAEQMYLMADEALKARAATCTKSQTLAHYGEQARIAKLEGGAA